jgi:hypothetical protein
MSTRKQPTLSEQGRRLSELQQRIVTIVDDAETQIRAEPKRADALHRRARTEAAPLLAEGEARRGAMRSSPARGGARSWPGAWSMPAVR